MIFSYPFTITSSPLILSFFLSQRGQRYTINRSVLLMVSSACATVRLITLSAGVLERAVLPATHLINHTAWAAQRSLPDPQPALPLLG